MALGHINFSLRFNYKHVIIVQLMWMVLCGTYIMDHLFVGAVFLLKNATAFEACSLEVPVGVHSGRWVTTVGSVVQNCTRGN